jgi:cell division protein FtsZ
MGDDVKITVIATGFRDEMPQRRERMLQGAALPASRAVEPVAPPPPPRIAQRPAPTPAPAFASEMYAAAEEHEAPVEVKQEKSARRKAEPVREEKREVAPAPEPVAAQPPPPPPPAPAPVAATRVEEPLRITPREEEPLRVTPRKEEPLRITPRNEEPLRVVPPAEPLRITPAEPDRVHGAYVPAASAEPMPELVPVPASVFDDDFFRKSNEELRPAPEPRSWESIREPLREPIRDTVRETARETIREPETPRPLEPVAAQHKKAEKVEKAETHWPEARVPSFAGYAGGSSSSSEEDELDIPAFLRRSR